MNGHKRTVETVVDTTSIQANPSASGGYYGTPEYSMEEKALLLGTIRCASVMTDLNDTQGRCGAARGCITVFLNVSTDTTALHLTGFWPSSRSVWRLVKAYLVAEEWNFVRAAFGAQGCIEAPAAPFSCMFSCRFRWGFHHSTRTFNGP